MSLVYNLIQTKIFATSLGLKSSKPSTFFGGIHFNLAINALPLITNYTRKLFSWFKVYVCY